MSATNNNNNNNNTTKKQQHHHTQTTHGTAASDRQASVLLAQDPQTLEAAYDAWASTYDQDLIQLSGHHGENEPGLAASKVLVKQFDLDDLSQKRILDFGCGTGRAAVFLHEQHGFNTRQQLDGCDLSQGMLDQAHQRHLYRQLIKSDFDSSHCSANTYDMIHASGVFAPGQAPPTAFDEFLRLLKPKGHAIFTIRTGYYDSDEGAAHRTHLEQLIANQKWKLIAKPEVDYLPKDGVTAYVFVLQKL